MRLMHNVAVSIIIIYKDNSRTRRRTFVLLMETKLPK